MSTSFPLPEYGAATIVLRPEPLRYNPCNDLIFPSLISTKGRVPNALGTYYLYYAPHDAPGGICLAYGESPEGPWTEYENNPILTRQWAPHYDVSHISSPHVIWKEDVSRFYLYFHGENDTTRLASSSDGLHFDYEGVVVSTSMYEGINESSYARVFPCTIPSSGEPGYVLLFMGNNNGTRRIYAAWSPDGKNFSAQKKPLINPPPGTEVTQVGGPWLQITGSSHVVLFHGDIIKPVWDELTTDIYAADVGAGFDQEKHLGLYYSRLNISDSNWRASDPFIFEENGESWLLLAVGGRLKQTIAVARAKKN